jgi:hypothetical protein
MVSQGVACVAKELAVTEIAYDESVCELRVLVAEPPKLGKGALPHVMGAMLDQPDFCRQLLEVIEAAKRRGVSLSEFIMAYADAEHELRPYTRARPRGA